MEKMDKIFVYSTKRHLLDSTLMGALLFGTTCCTAENCSFSAPDGWAQKNTRWQGECTSGLANGTGVLKEYEGKEVKHLFFGEIKNGEVIEGVIDTADGFQAGRFSNGKLQQSDERQIYLNAFKKAEQAAESTAGKFEKEGNKASANFYRNKAKKLREQMD